MSALLATLHDLLFGVVVTGIPALCGFGLGVRWATTRRTNWRARALRAEAERDRLRVRAGQVDHDLAGLTERVRRIRGVPAGVGGAVPGAARPSLHVIRTGATP